MTLRNGQQDIEEQGNHKDDDIEGVEEVLTKKQQQPDGLWVKTNIGIQRRQLDKERHEVIVGQEQHAKTQNDKRKPVLLVFGRIELLRAIENIRKHQENQAIVGRVQDRKDDQHKQDFNNGHLVIDRQLIRVALAIVHDQEQAGIQAN